MSFIVVIRSGISISVLSVSATEISGALCWMRILNAGRIQTREDAGFACVSLGHEDYSWTNECVILGQIVVTYDARR